MIITETGVYGDTEAEFFQKLLSEKITLFIDVRQRRGMRGIKYAFANSIYLQNKLKDLGIKYIHMKELAPTAEIREEQKKYDLNIKQLKRSREFLSEKFIELYKEKVLSHFDFQHFISEFALEKVVFFCVEKNCLACHRKLIFDTLKKEYKIDGYGF